MAAGGLAGAGAGAAGAGVIGAVDGDATSSDNGTMTVRLGGSGAVAIAALGADEVGWRLMI